MKLLPIGIQTFESLREGNFLYVDKTHYLYELVNPASARYFLSRPRRFGKSLTISTLDAIFRGKKELFKGLWIYTSDYNWQQYPVIRIDMSVVNRDNPDSLKVSLKILLGKIAQHHDVLILNDASVPLEDSFSFLIQALRKKYQQRVVILIDEYDKPILDRLDDVERAHGNREVLRSFYGVMKGLDEYIRFIFLTGVTKFSKVSVFSGLNNLYDLTMDPAYSTMLGYTQQELETCFTEHIDAFAEREKIPKAQLLEEIRQWYNGFRFSKRDETVYNPFSTLLLFQGKDFRDYWFETATPDFLINLIKKQEYNIFQAEQEPVSEDTFSTFQAEQLDILALLVQTGYFTIKNYDTIAREYRLGYPNKEVEIAFTKDVLRVFMEQDKQHVSTELIQLRKNLEKENLKTFFEQLRVFIADIPYTIRKARDEEQEYQLILYAILRCIGIRVSVEITTNRGRIDAVIELTDKIYVCEFKLNGTQEDALAQIKNKGYYEKYQKKGKTIICVGVAIDREKRNMGEYVAEKI